MATTFTIQLKCDPKVFIERVRNEITENNGQLTGDEKKGSFIIPVLLSKITGDYEITGRTMVISNVSKPIYITDKQMLAELEKFNY